MEESQKETVAIAIEESVKESNEAVEVPKDTAAVEPPTEEPVKEETSAQEQVKKETSTQEQDKEQPPAEDPVKEEQPVDEPAKEAVTEAPVTEESKGEEPAKAEENPATPEKTSDSVQDAPKELDTIREEATAADQQPPVEGEKSKKVKVQVKVSDHAEDKVDNSKAEVKGDMGTLFILDLMRQKREKLMRKKKDDLINDLAMKKKREMLEARRGQRVLTRPAINGFLGVNAILSGSQPASPASRRRTPKPEERGPQVDIPPPERTDLLIMGIIRDKKEEKFHEAHHVRRTKIYCLGH